MKCTCTCCCVFKPLGLERFHNLKMDIRRLALLADVGSMYTGCGSSLVPRPRGLGTRLGVVLVTTCRAEALAAEIKELQGEMADYNTVSFQINTLSLTNC